jgi:hypothetical protein
MQFPLIHLQGARYTQLPMARHFFTFFNLDLDLDLEVCLVFPFLKEMKWIVELNFYLDVVLFFLII